jgi:PAS domain S-box-containing protein
MKEFDQAWAKYQNELNLLSLPITNWEFLEGYSSDEVEFRKIQKNWSDNTNYMLLAKKQNSEFLVTDKNFKIIYASKNIMRINGYEIKEIIGKSPSMFQGADTSEITKKNIRESIKNLKPFKEVILNYKKSGEKYYCHIEAYPKFGKNGEFLNYIAIEKIAS